MIMISTSQIKGKEVISGYSHLGRRCRKCKKTIMPKEKFLRVSVGSKGRIDSDDPISYIDIHEHCLQ